MAIYSISQRSTVTTTAAAAWELRSTSANKPKVMELGISLGAATASVYGIGRPAAIGVTPTSPVTALDESDGNGPTGLTTCAVAWGTGPTVPANFFRRVSLPATIGAGVILTFPRGLGLPVSGSIVMWNITTNSAVVDFWACVDE
jgi:hypothetical protein